MSGFVNAPCYVEGQGIIRCNLSFKNGKIAEIGNSKIDNALDLPEGAIVFPAFIDQHIHGAFGGDAMDGSYESLEKISASIAREGTAYFLATTMTQSKEAIISALRNAKEYIYAKKTAFNRPIAPLLNGASLLGVHLEGPFINPKYGGAQPKEYIVEPNVELFDELYNESGALIKIVTLAPESENAKAFIERLVELGVSPSIGHSAANYEQVISAAKWGAKSITHTFNAQSPLHHRDIGVVGGAILNNDLYTEIIADYIHVSPPAIKLLIKNKPHDKVILITDSMRAKHLPDGVSELGGQKVIVKDGQARLEDGTLAGSVLKMNEAIKNIVGLGISITDAVDFATINPATHLGLNNEIGSIRQGKAASFTIVNKDFDILYTILNGQIIYKNHHVI